MLSSSELLVGLDDIGVGEQLMAIDKISSASVIIIDTI